MWHRGAIRLTHSQLVAVAGLGQAEATGPRQHAYGLTDSGEARGGAAQCVAREARVMSREGLGVLGRR
jgi:hypothetical protein